MLTRSRWCSIVERCLTTPSLHPTNRVVSLMTMVIAAAGRERTCSSWPVWSSTANLPCQTTNWHVVVPSSSRTLTRENPVASRCGKANRIRFSNNRREVKKTRLCFECMKAMMFEWCYFLQNFDWFVGLCKVALELLSLKCCVAWCCSQRTRLAAVGAGAGARRAADREGSGLFATPATTIRRSSAMRHVMGLM